MLGPLAPAAQVQDGVAVPDDGPAALPDQPPVILAAEIFISIALIFAILAAFANDERKK